MQPVRHVQHVHLRAEDREPPVVQRRHDVAAPDVVVDHVVRHQPDAGEDSLARACGRIDEAASLSVYLQINFLGRGTTYLRFPSTAEPTEARTTETVSPSPNIYGFGALVVIPKSFLLAVGRN